MFLALFFLCVLNFSSYSCLDLQDDEVDYFKVIQNARKLSQEALKYSPQQNQVNHGQFLVYSKKDAITRAEELLASGLDVDSPYNVSSLCLNHTKLFLEALVNKEQWALRMLDSMGKPGSGLLDGQVHWVGNWEECLEVQASFFVDNSTGIIHPYKGKYCRGYIPVQQAVVAMGICFPDSCSQTDATALLNTFLSLLPVSVPLGGVCTCQENSQEFSDKAIAVIIVCSVFLAVIILATAYDVILRHIINSPTNRNKESKDEAAFNEKPVNEKKAFGHVTEENMPLLDDSYQKDMVSHHSIDIKRIDPPSKPEAPVTTTYQPGLCGKLLLCFSVYTNASKLLSTNLTAGTLTNVNGVRFISMTWVILGHTFYFGLNAADNAATFLPRMFKRFTFQAIANETVAVDTFFALSGLLVAYLTLREMKKRGGARRFNWLMFYFHRFWRLTPPYMLFLMLYVPTVRYYGDGPFWPQQGTEINECENSWWTNLLYINNLVKTDEMCMGWSWYLANDMQFYVISPLMLVPLYYSKVLGTLVCFAFILGNFIATGLISKHNEMQANILFNTGPDAGNANAEIYMKPWCRVGPYAVGIYTGYLLYKTDCKWKMPKLQARVLNLLGWTVATAFAMLVLYGLYSPDGKPDLDLNTSAFYNATSRTAWGIAVAWVVFACASGYGGPVNALLSWKGIIPLSRLTYCAYLVHPIVMFTYFYSRRTLVHYYDINMVYLYLGNLCVSYAVAFVVSMAFESPMMGLEKVLLGRKKNS